MHVHDLFERMSVLENRRQEDRDELTEVLVRIDRRLSVIENTLEVNGIRFAEFEQRMGERFTMHMTEIENYYAARDRKYDEDMQQIKQDLDKLVNQ